LQWLVVAVQGAALGLVLFELPAALDMVGMGDVKLIVAIGAPDPLAPRAVRRAG
jgi:Flp pilus assembly protein protease CpaA